MAAEWLVVHVKVDNGIDGSRHELPKAEKIAAVVRDKVEGYRDPDGTGWRVTKVSVP